MGDRLLRAVERFLIPWYDRAKAEEAERAADERERHTEEIRQRSIGARISAEQIRRDYAAMSRKLGR